MIFDIIDTCVGILIAMQSLYHFFRAFSPRVFIPNLISGYFGLTFMREDQCFFNFDKLNRSIIQQSYLDYFWTVHLCQYSVVRSKFSPHHSELHRNCILRFSGAVGVFFNISGFIKLKALLFIGPIPPR